MRSLFKLKLGISIAVTFTAHSLGATPLPLENYYFEEFMISQRTYCLFFEDNFYYETLPSRKIQEVSDPKKTLEPKLPKTLSEAPTALGDKVSSWKEIDTQ